SYRRAPRTWGWTGLLHLAVGRVLPSPTHVGMDRRPRVGCTRSCTEPHARGDGPEGPKPLTDMRARAPRTWGWTDVERPAGGPLLRAPRTWGWTEDFPSTRVHVLPSPTHVGMDRSAATSFM